MGEEECSKETDVCGTGPILIMDKHLPTTDMSNWTTEYSNYTYYSGCVDISYCGVTHDLYQTVDWVPMVGCDVVQSVCTAGFHTFTRNETCDTSYENVCARYTVRAGTIVGTMNMGCLSKGKCGGQIMAEFGWAVDQRGEGNRYDYLPVKVTGYIRCLQGFGTASNYTDCGPIDGSGNETSCGSGIVPGKNLTYNAGCVKPEKCGTNHTVPTENGKGNYTVKVECVAHPTAPPPTTTTRGPTGPAGNVIKSHSPSSVPPFSFFFMFVWFSSMVAMIF